MHKCQWVTLPKQTLLQPRVQQRHISMLPVQRLPRSGTSSKAISYRPGAKPHMLQIDRIVGWETLNNAQCLLFMYTAQLEIPLIRSRVVPPRGIVSLTQAIADLDAAMTEATDLRNTENARNTEIIAGFKDSQIAIAPSSSCAQRFDAKAAQATSLVQGGKDPTIF